MDRTCSRHVRDKRVMKYFSRTTEGNRLKRKRKVTRQRERGVLLNDVCQLLRPHKL